MLRPYFLTLLSVSLLDYVIIGKSIEKYIRDEVLCGVDTSLEICGQCELKLSVLRPLWNATHSIELIEYSN